MRYLVLVILILNPLAALAVNRLDCELGPNSKNRFYTIMADVNHSQPLPLLSNMDIYFDQNKVGTVRKSNVIRYKYKRGNLVIRTHKTKDERKQKLWIAAKRVPNTNRHTGTAVMAGKSMPVTCVFR